MNAYYIPHQAVMRPESTTTKMRIVFDASAKATTGCSLNDKLFCGKKLQQNLPANILRFRLHPVLFTADIKQMFRQVVVTEKHRPYQRLLYRFSLDVPVEEFQMNTLTFGQKSSPFLAIRTLHQLVEDKAANDKHVQKVVLHNLYVDDVVTGAETEDAAIELQKKLMNAFSRGKFELRKWSSNSNHLLQPVPPKHRQSQPVTFAEHGSEYTKVLGLNWDPKNASLSYQYQPNPVKYSKR
ncbi:Integrase catalytic domain-containing protein, partial [Aphis craccivora]